MNNIEFKEKFIEYINSGFIIRSGKKVPDNSIKCKVGKKVFYLKYERLDFLNDINEKILNKVFMSRTMIQAEYNLSISTIKKRLLDTKEWSEYHFAGIYYLYFKNN
ncbi:MAG: hypothetical protein RRY36_05280 [Bacteroidaceae bacterium]